MITTLQQQLQHIKTKQKTLFLGGDTMENKNEENQEELYSCYSSEDELVMTEEIKQVLDEQSKEIWKEIEKKLCDEFINEFTKCWQEMFPGLSE